MPDLYRYSSKFEPILLEDYTATLYSSYLPVGGYNVKCLAVGALPEYYKDFGALTATVWDADNEDTNLEVNPLEFAQYRFRIMDDMKCRMKNPNAVTQWRTKAAIFYLPRFPSADGYDFLREYYWKASEFFVWEENTPRFDFYSDFSLTTAKVLFSGWRFKVQKIATPGKIKILLDDWPGGGSA